MSNNNTLLVIFILGRYVNSIILSIYNKWMFDPVNGINIPYPILITAFHQLTLFGLSYIFMEREPFNVVHTKKKQSYKKSTELSYYSIRKFLIDIVPIAIAAAGDTGFSNSSLKFIPLTVFTIIRSINIVFVLVFSVLFNMEHFHKRLIVIIAGIFLGIVIMISDAGARTDAISASDLAFGVSLALISSCLSGFKLVYTKKSLSNKKKQKFKEVVNPMTQINRISIVTFTLLFTASMVIERPFPHFFHSNLFKRDINSSQVTILSGIKGLLFLLFPGMEIFIITYCEFGILQISKVLILSMAAIAKEILTIILGIVLFEEKFNSTRSFVGICIIFVIITYYNYMKGSKKSHFKNSQKNSAHNKKNPMYLSKPNESQMNLAALGEEDSLSARNIDINIPFYYNKIHEENEDDTVIMNKFREKDTY